MSQRRMGPAPFASFEDLSDEVESPTSVVPSTRLPDIRECPLSTDDANDGGTISKEQHQPQQCLQTPNMPRIDISRASSSSHHEEDSRDSTPERELFEPQCRLGLAFREDGAMDLRSSTEELDFQDPDAVAATSGKTGAVDRQSDTTGHESTPHARKDSQGSELAFLSVSGRTSRLSSIGSQGSRASNQSHLSGFSRSPSPHKMLLETSFCGTKGTAAGGMTQPVGGVGATLEPALEQALLSRKLDPTEAVLAEGISIEMRKKIQPANSVSPKRRPPPTPIPIVVEPDQDHPESDVVHPVSPGKTIIAESGTEYTFIPLKGPLPSRLGNKPQQIGNQPKNRGPAPVPARRTNIQAKKTPTPPARAPPPVAAAKTTSDGPEYIRIKLKPDHMYTDSDSTCTNTYVTKQSNVSSSPDIHKPITLNLNNGTSMGVPQVTTTMPSGSPKLPRLRDTALSRTPSPSVSRKSSFTSLFRSKEAIISSPESPGDRSRSKSKERELKSVFGIFKPKKSCIKKQTSPEVVQVTSPLPSLEFTFNSKPQKERLKYYETPLEGDSIRIPLHSPGTEPEPLKLLSPSPPTVQSPPEVETMPKTPQDVPSPAVPPPVNPRHSSTSSETIVFTTNLGSNNDIFTTKLPKEKVQRITENHCEKPVERRTSIAESEKAKLPPVLASLPNEPSVTSGQLTRSESSESEREIPERDSKARSGDLSSREDDEHELKTLVFQQDSFEEDELPYVPTTLPLERSVAVPIVPVKQRGEIKMCPIERPRSTTPINPSCLEEYCEDGVVAAEPKLRISLPRDDPPQSKGKSGRGRRWADFAEKDMGGSLSPPPLPPRGATTHWINFEEVPERRKAPKRIQMIPSSGHAGRRATDMAGTSDDNNVIYSYVNPEDCKCECHELAPRGTQSEPPQQPTPDAFPNHQKLSS